MLRITSEKKRGKVVLTVEGRLAGPWVGTLEQCWRELRAASAKRKVQRESLRRQLHRSGRKDAAEGHPPPGRPAGGGRMSEPGDRSRNQRQGGQTRSEDGDDQGRSQGFADRFLRGVVRPAGELRDCCARKARSRRAFCRRMLRPTMLRLTLEQAVSLATEAEHDGADCDFDGGAERAGQEHGPGGAAAASEPET